MKLYYKVGEKKKKQNKTRKADWPSQHLENVIGSLCHPIFARRFLTVRNWLSLSLGKLCCILTWIQTLRLICCATLNKPVNSSEPHFSSRRLYPVASGAAIKLKKVSCLKESSILPWTEQVLKYSSSSFSFLPSQRDSLAPIYIIYRWLPFAISQGKQPLGDWKASTLWMLCCDCFCHHHEEHHHHLHGDESTSSGSPGEHGFLISRPIMYLEILKHEGRYRQKRWCVSHILQGWAYYWTKHPLCLCLCPVETPSPLHHLKPPLLTSLFWLNRHSWEQTHLYLS